MGRAAGSWTSPPLLFLETGMITKFYGGPLDGHTGESPGPTTRALVGDMVEGQRGPAFVLFHYIPVHTDNMCQIMYLHDVQAAEMTDPWH